MAGLSEEERRQIYEEEKARIEEAERIRAEARADVERDREAAPTAPVPTPAAGGGLGSGLLYGVGALLVVGGLAWGYATFVDVDHMTRAQNLVAQRKYQEAVDEFRLVATDDPRYGEAQAALPLYESLAAGHAARDDAERALGIDRAAIGDAAADARSEAIMAEAREEQKVVVRPNWKWSGGDGDFDYVRGSIRNGASKDVSYWEVTVEFLDGKGAIIDSDMTNDGQTLRAGAEKRFEVIHSRVPGAKSARAYVSKVHW